MKTAALALLLLAPLASGCATDEYVQEARICEASWMRAIPPRHQDRLVEEMRPEQRPTGRTDCVTQGARTVCQQQMETVFVPHQVWVSVDVSKPERDAQIASCAAEACVARMGNAECK